MPKTEKFIVEFTRAELEATFIAVSNYTPGKGFGWKQAAQGRVANKIGRAWGIAKNRQLQRTAKATAMRVKVKRVVKNPRKITKR